LDNSTKYKVGSAVFSNKFGLGIVVEVQPENNLIKARMLETDKIESLSLGGKSIKLIKDYDPELALPRELKSTEALREERRKLAGIKEVRKSTKAKTRKPKLDTTEMELKIKEKVLRGEKVNLEDLIRKGLL